MHTVPVRNASSAPHAECGALLAVPEDQDFDQIDADAMYTNCITSTVIKSAMVPCVLSTDKEAIQFCLRTANRIDRDNPRVIRIQNSLHVGQVMLSEAYYADVRAGKYPGLEALDAPEPLAFDSDDALITPWLNI